MKERNCDVYQRDSLDQVDLQKQLLVHRKQRMFGKGLSNKHAISLKLMTEARKLYSCKLCKKRFAYVSTLLMHQRGHLAKNNVKIDKKKITTKKCLKVHEDSHVRDVNKRSSLLEARKLHECNICKKRFTFVYTLLMHQRSHIARRACKVCKKNFETEKDLKVHEDSNACDVDEGHSSKLGSLKRDKNARKKPYKCKVCEKCFLQKNHLAAHTRNHLAKMQYLKNSPQKGFLNKLSQIKMNPNSKKISSCKSSAQKDNLTEQTNLHSEKRYLRKSSAQKAVSKVQTNLKLASGTKSSPRSSAQKDILNEQMSIHTSSLAGKKSCLSSPQKIILDEEKNIQSFECKMCHKSFAHRDNLYKHNRTHSGKKPFECEICNKSFTRQFSLTKHALLHTGEKPHKCEICAYTCAHRSNLNKHMRIHNGEKPYKCEMCNFSCARKSNLDKHVYTHSRQKPYECEICDKRYVRKKGLNAHLRKSHSDVNNKLSRDNSFDVYNRNYSKEFIDTESESD